MHRKEPLLSVLKKLSQNTCQVHACKISHKDKQWQELSEQKLLWYHCCYHIDDVNDIHYLKKELNLNTGGTRGQEIMTYHDFQSSAVALDKSD